LNAFKVPNKTATTAIDATVPNITNIAVNPPTEYTLLNKFHAVQFMAEAVGLELTNPFQLCVIPITIIAGTRMTVANSRLKAKARLSHFLVSPVKNFLYVLAFPRHG